MQEPLLEEHIGSPRRPYAWAAPSFVIPGTVKENVRFLTGKAPEVALCLFETASCLAYGKDDLPESMPMRCHVHLPCDLDWSGEKNPKQAGGKAAKDALAVLGKAAGFSPSLCVLHPPTGPSKDFLLEGFLKAWKQHSTLPVLLENVQGSPLVDLAPDLFFPGEFGVCLDVGHMLCYGQERILEGTLPSRARLLHWSAPGGKDRHLSLDKLEEGEVALAVKALQATPREAVQLLEIFNWQGVERSLPVLDRIWNMAKPEETANRFA